METNVKSLANGTDATLHEVADKVSNEAARFGEMARNFWTRNADIVRDAASTVRDEASAFGDRTQRYVKDEPIKSVLMAAVIGAAVTGLVALLMRDRD